MPNNQDLKELKACRERWMAWMDISQRHGIWYQIAEMSWNTAVFHLVDEAARLAPAATEGGVQLNGMLFDFIRRCFTDSHLAGIRRLCDRGPLKGPKGVCSLYALLNEMEDKADLMTRENLFAIDGMQYDLEAAERREREYRARTEAEGASAVWAPPELDVEPIRRRHTDIDVLAGVGINHRSRTDCVRRQVFEWLKDRLEATVKHTVEYCNKFVAHAATAESRQGMGAKAFHLTWEELWRSHKVIFQVANFTDSCLLSRSEQAVVPIPPGDYLAYIDRLLVTSQNVDKLKDAWERFESETHEWRRWGLTELAREVDGSPGAHRA